MKKLITRADDLGLNSSTNKAIYRTTATDFIKNISVMAVGAALSESAEMFKDVKGVCFGLHAVLTSEWDDIKWGSLSKHPSLETKDGYFHARSENLRELNLDPDVVLKEFDLQLEKVAAAGFKLSYVDCHMGVEFTSPQIMDATRAWAYKKGLRFAADYYTFLGERANEIPNEDGLFAQELSQAQQDIYTIFLHPALYSQEMKRFVNIKNPGWTVAYQRQLDYMFACDASNVFISGDAGFTCARYDEI